MIINNEKIYKRWIVKAVSFADREILSFAQKWADLIEKEIKLGNSLEDVWRKCKVKAKNKVISIKMEKQAELFLIQTWVYGGALKVVTRHGEQRENRTYYNNGR